jgi:D-cysteine desulfhydrase
LIDLPRLGLVAAPSPLTALPELARELSVRSVHVKRDDLLPALFGGSKVRKLDTLLATEPYASARGFVGIGAIGSGLLVALAAASARLNKPLHACTFHEHIDDHVRDNFAYVSSRADRLDYFRSRATLALRMPRLFTRAQLFDRAIVPPGATNAAGMGGIVLAALELAAQMEVSPDRIVVALGSGGTAVGLSVGLALAGWNHTIIDAVSAIERPFSSAGHLAKATRDLLAWLTKSGVPGIASLKPLPIVIDRGALGAGYGIPTAASIAACHRLRAHGIHLEPIYSGKAMASLLAAPRGSRVVFWQTNRGAAPTLDRAPRIPASLRHAGI